MWETNNVFRLKHAYYYVPVCVVLKIIFINSGQQKIVHMTCALMCGLKKKGHFKFHRTHHLNGEVHQNG